MSASATFRGSPRSVAFNVQGFRVAVHPATGEVAILQSVQAADAGVVMNPGQCRAQVEGGVVQALGAAMFEEVEIDDAGAVVDADASAPTTCPSSATSRAPRCCSPTRTTSSVRSAPSR